MGRRSYSVPLRPDLALWIPNGRPNSGLHLLDAKFKVVWKNWLDDESDLEERENAKAERRGEFKRADLYKMHTYREAIPEARTAWILYPGTDVRFFCVDGPVAESMGEMRDVLDGVGGVPLPTTGPGHDLTELMGRLLSA